MLFRNNNRLDTSTLAKAGHQMLNSSHVQDAPSTHEISYLAPTQTMEEKTDNKPKTPIAIGRKYTVDKRAAGMGYRREGAYNIISNE